MFDIRACMQNYKPSVDNPLARQPLCHLVSGVFADWEFGPIGSRLNTGAYQDLVQAVMDMTLTRVSIRWVIPIGKSWMITDTLTRT